MRKKKAESTIRLSPKQASLGVRATTNNAYVHVSVGNGW